MSVGDSGLVGSGWGQHGLEMTVNWVTCQTSQECSVRLGAVRVNRELKRKVVTLPPQNLVKFISQTAFPKEDLVLHSHTTRIR